VTTSNAASRMAALYPFEELQPFESLEDLAET
jgi:hypothetical protein